MACDAVRAEERTGYVSENDKTVVKRYRRKNGVNYFADIVVHSGALAETLEQLDALLTVLRADNIKRELKEYHFARTNIGLYDIRSLNKAHHRERATL